MGGQLFSPRLGDIIGSKIGAARATENGVDMTQAACGMATTWVMVIMSMFRRMPALDCSADSRFQGVEAWPGVHKYQLTYTTVRI